MRVQSINSNNYQRKQPEFKANVHASIDFKCPHPVVDLCEEILGKDFVKTAVEGGHVKPENAVLAFNHRFNQHFDLVILDKTTPLAKSLKRKPELDPEEIIKAVKEDKESVDISNKIEQEPVCFKSLFIRSSILSKMGDFFSDLIN